MLDIVLAVAAILLIPPYMSKQTDNFLMSALTFHLPTLGQNTEVTLGLASHLEPAVTQNCVSSITNSGDAIFVAKC